MVRPTFSRRMKAMIASLFLGLGLLAVKLWAARISGSVALLSDALEGLVNILAAAFGIFSVRFAEQPADIDHPYGHGKIEYFAAAFEGGLIVLAAVLIGYESINRMLHPQSLQSMPLAITLSLAAGCANGALGFYLIKLGKRERSPTLESDGLHLYSDFVSSVVLFVGLLLVTLTHIAILDSILALIASLWMMYTGYKVITGAINPLLDAEDPAFVLKIAEALNSAPESRWIDVHDLKSRRNGQQRQLDFHLAVPEYLSIDEAHNIADSLEGHLQKQFSEDIAFQTHIDPCMRQYCASCAENSCPVRQMAFKNKNKFDHTHLTRIEKF